MDIFDFDDGRYDKFIITEALHFYRSRYNDWKVLESEFKYKIDETRNWTEQEVHECVNYIHGLMIKLQEASKGIFVPNEQWFSTQVEDFTYWQYYKQTMREKHWSPDRIQTLTKECTDLVNMLPNPLRNYNENCPSLFKRKGLVYGNVQSGKTANIAGLIAMYASAACPLIIVLSGVTNNLRNQTQDRLIEDLKMHTKKGWHVLTEDRDQISNNHKYIETLLSGEDVCVGVFKKNPSALNSLINYCKKTTNKDIWKKNQVLIIDDECDQYSPNVELRDEDTDEVYKHSKINSLIVDLIKLFPRVSYVGYTATPFANVLNEEPGEESLYPEHFIYALSKNDSYYGSEKVFGDEEDPDPITLDAINHIDNNDCTDLINGEATELPDSLKESINYFVLATACKYKRSLYDNSSMLIHINLKTAIHSAVEDLVINYFDNFADLFSSRDPVLLSKLEALWNSEKDKNPPKLITTLFPNSKIEDYYLPSFNELEDQIQEVIDKLEIVVDNSSRTIDRRLHYSKENPHPYIVIGGNTLSRGLTLEGLIVSYFSRASKNYDTLLQMGRWFGYRTGYEDLSRIWMPEKLEEFFRFLCTVENEIREEITNYTFEITPKDFGMRIRMHPFMHITRTRAMQAAKQNMVNFSGTFAETYNLEKKDLNIINHNLEATKKFLSSLSCKPEKYHNAWIYRDCDVQHILDFTNDYIFSEKNITCDRDSIISYLNKALERNYMRNWHVIVKTRQDGNHTIKLDDRITCYPLNRSRRDEHIETSYAHFSDIKDARDLMIDIDDETWSNQENSSKVKQMKARKAFYQEKNQPIPGLLLIYPIDKDSIPKNDNKTRAKLEANGDLIGLLYLFPQIEDKAIFQYMSIPLEVNNEDEEGV